MAKISRVSLARKRELEKPDVILDSLQRVSSWTGLHKRQVIVTAVILMAVIVVITGVSYCSIRAEQKAFDRLTQIMPVNSENAEAGGDKVDAAEQYRLLNEKYGRTLAGKIAGLKYADDCYHSKDYEKAIAAYRKALSDFEDSDFFRTLALNGLGYAYEASGAYDQASACFKQILDDPRATIKDQALFHLGRLYELSGDLKNSRAMFERIVADYPDSLYARIVREGDSG